MHRQAGRNKAEDGPAAAHALSDVEAIAHRHENDADEVGEVGHVEQQPTMLQMQRQQMICRREGGGGARGKNPGVIGRKERRGVGSGAGPGTPSTSKASTMEQPTVRKKQPIAIHCSAKITCSATSPKHFGSEGWLV